MLKKSNSRMEPWGTSVTTIVSFTNSKLQLMESKPFEMFIKIIHTLHHCLLFRL